MNVSHDSRLYLSRLLLNPRSRQVMSEIAHPYEMHRTLMRAFPKREDQAEAKAREKYGVLFRVETDDKSRLVKVYVQSLAEPDWSFLDGLNDYLCDSTEALAYEHKDIWPAWQKLQSGQILSFRLRANPTKRIAKEGDPLKGKRVQLQREDDQIAWLLRKGREMGTDMPGGFDLLMKKVKDGHGNEFLVPRVHVISEGKYTGRKKDAAIERSTTHFAAHFEGLLQVTDADAFLQTLIRGIGSGKAFGFGLLSIAPAGLMDNAGGL